MAASDVVIVEGIRTPYVKAGGAFNFISPQELGRIAVSELLAKIDLDPNIIDEVVIGNIGQPAEATNIARVISLNSHIPRQVPAYTVQRNCASGMEAIAQAYTKIRLGQAQVVIAG